MAVLEEQSTREPQVRAAGAPPRPNVALTPCLVEEADFIAAPRPGLTPDDLTRGREVGEGLHRAFSLSQRNSGEQSPRNAAH